MELLALSCERSAGSVSYPRATRATRHSRVQTLDTQTPKKQTLKLYRTLTPQKTKAYKNLYNPQPPLKL
jgi:hypothetical protein